MIRFIVPGEPVGKARPRVMRSGHAYTPEKTVLYENLIKMEFERQCAGSFFPKEMPVALTVEAIYQIPKSASRKKREAMMADEIRPTKKPDCDNLLKCVADSLNGIAYADDSQIVTMCCDKFYGEVPRIEVTISEI